MLPQAFLRDLDLRPRVRQGDTRQIDLVARGLPLFGGLPICGDAAVVSALHGDGTPWAGAADENGVALRRTGNQHRDQYRELCNSDRVKFVMLGAETGGRLSQEALPVLWGLAAAKAREAPKLLARRAQYMWHRRWLIMIAVAVQNAVAESILEPCSSHRTEMDGPAPLWSEIGGRDVLGAGSRLPLR